MVTPSRRLRKDESVHRALLAAAIAALMLELLTRCPAGAATIRPRTQGETVLHVFAGSDGGYPYASVVDAKGQLFGTVTAGNLGGLDDSPPVPGPRGRSGV